MRTESPMDTLPKELTAKREITESNFIMCLFMEPDLVSDYVHLVIGEDIFTHDGMFYYSIVKRMYEKGYRSFNQMDVLEYIGDNKMLMEEFTSRGGFETIQELMSCCSVINFNLYYDELIKNNYLIKMYEKKYPVLEHLEEFIKMTSSEVYDYYEKELADISVAKTTNLKVENLSEAQAYKDAYTEWNKGNDVGIRISSPKLNNQLLGVHKKNLMFHAAGIGFGKTSSAIEWYILPALEDGHNVTVVANEQDLEAWRKMLIATVLFNKIGHVDGFSRQRMAKGNYTQEQWAKMDQAADWLEQQPGKLYFVEMEDYSVESVRKIITKQAKAGSELIIYDTMKSENDGDTSAWGKFSDVAKSLFLLAKHLDVAIVATIQLTPDALNRTFLDLTAIGRARAIAEVANSVVMFRPLQEAEIPLVKGFTYEGKMRKEVTLDPTKSYICVYFPKNRYGAVSPQIIMERNLNFNTYKDVCSWNCPYEWPSFMKKKGDK